AALQRAERLPFQAVERIAGGMPLRQGDASELLAPVVVVALGAGEIELALAAGKDGAPALDDGLEPRVVAADGKPARLAADESGEREQVLALACELRRPLSLGTADVDAAGKVDRRPAPGVVGRIARGNALHAL